MTLREWDESTPLMIVRTRRWLQRFFKRLRRLFRLRVPSPVPAVEDFDWRFMQGRAGDRCPDCSGYLGSGGVCFKCGKTASYSELVEMLHHSAFCAEKHDGCRLCAKVREFLSKRILRALREKEDV